MGPQQVLLIRVRLDLEVMLYTAPAVLPRRLHIAVELNNKKNNEHLYIKNITYFLYFPGLLRVWSVREKERESRRVMSAYEVDGRSLHFDR